MAPLVSEIDASVYVLDGLPNMLTQTVEDRVELWVNLLRREHPGTPIVLMENTTYQNALHAGRTELYTSRNQALRAAFGRLQAQRVTDLHLIPGAALLGDDWEATIDGSQPQRPGLHAHGSDYRARVAPAGQGLTLQAPAELLGAQFALASLLRSGCRLA